MAGLDLQARRFLPDDGYAGTLVARAWRPDVQGPAVVALREQGVVDLSAAFPTMATLLEQADPAGAARAASGERLGSVDDLLANSDEAGRDAGRPFFLAPCDLQVVKAAGVTFATSLLERLIEEQADGDPGKAQDVRAQVVASIGTDLSKLKPGSEQAMALKKLLQDKGLWSQYLEVGIGPDAEVFSKAPVLSSVGTGADIGIRSDSSWNNPEPEVVLAVDSRGRIVGATLGNDVNLRDLEGRSALLLSKAKDNNASCAIGPFIRLFDASFGLVDVRRETVDLRVDGPEGFVLEGLNSMAFISREPQDIVDQTMAAHQYPDGFMLFLGTLFAPTQDRDAPGGGFTHKLGDRVSIRSARLGELCNRVTHSERAAPWTFGLRALMANLARRGLLDRGL
ncbi:MULTISPECIES: fumarylacetoacetate hydrolase family protein [Ramlibacter]|uniref:Fumarylacetoacetate hydrolase n=1 Tax=Ramlibacter pinisoli TaxID=2682844 RepID=A0A6N8IT44_9BURK|nr:MULTISPECIES: fumarylacetoacetate hydrolase family protein [Ramlibacter]MBA2964394.1 fumarylacetoacetate hydrolase family protein [Ramlibacter sp. CGMCC 1.13660]MVQ29360.1 fumarylacetoacetate hydrolase [Ramlibacter pinisoli]